MKIYTSSHLLNSVSRLDQLDFVQSYQKALRVDPSYKLAAECLAIVLTDLGTNLKLAGSVQEGIQKYHEALIIDPHYAVISFYYLMLSASPFDT